MAGTRSRPSPELAAAFESRLRGWLEPGERLSVALSGGRDSVVLLDLAIAAAPHLGLVLGAIHIDHGLSPKAGSWAAFCVDLCRRRGVPCQVIRVRVDAQPGEGLEAAARRARYAAFSSCAADAIALAHHAGDQAETMLFRLMRGAGIDGAAGMPERRLLSRPEGGPLVLLRPLLDVSPAAIAAHAETRELEFVDDESNGDVRYSRNFLRHEILPVVDARFPGAGRRLAAAAGRFREAAGLLDALADLDLARCAGVRGLKLVDFRGFPPDRQRNLLRRWLRRFGVGLPSSAWLEQARRQLIDVGSDGQVSIGIGDYELHVWRGELSAERRSPQPPAELDWAGERCLGWAGGVIVFESASGEGIAAGKLAGHAVVCRPRQGGERFRPDRKRPRRSLKHWLQEADIEPWRRHLLPCLWCDDDLVWVPGIGVDAEYAAGDGEPSWRVGWRPSG